MSNIKDSLFERPVAASTASAPAAASAPGDDAKVKRVLVEVLSGSVEGAGIEDFGQLKQCFVDANLEPVFRSWMTRKSNLELKPSQLRAALGGTKLINVVATRAGITEENVVDRLAVVLPRLVNEVTPFGADADPKAVQFHLQSLRKRLRT